MQKSEQFTCERCEMKLLDVHNDDAAALPLTTGSELTAL